MRKNVFHLKDISAQNIGNIDYCRTGIFSLRQFFSNNYLISSHCKVDM